MIDDIKKKYIPAPVCFITALITEKFCYIAWQEAVNLPMP